MADVTTTAAGEPQALDRIGDRLREERVKAGISQRELARRLGLSASLISQLESGQSRPSVGTLYLIVTELGVSLDDVIRGEESGAPADGNVEVASNGSPVLHPAQRTAIDLDSGVRWEELAAHREDGIDFLEAIYEVGGASTTDRSLIRHQGREYGYIISGTLGVQIGFQEHVLSPGDSIAFDSTTPHRLFNVGDEPVHAIWFVVGRLGDHDHG
jgi:transcriptional regulator with XRE-family HTH domain